jgi:hypothetical protein
MEDTEGIPLFALSEVDLQKLKAEGTDMASALSTQVSDAVRKECEKELADAAKRDYRIKGA